MQPCLWQTAANNDGDRAQATCSCDSANDDTTLGVNGENVAKVAFRQGTFVQSDASTWKEYSAGDVDFASPHFTFHENRRDEWSVYLTDRSRGVHLQLDLHTKIVYYSDRTSPRRELYTIIGAYRPLTFRYAATTAGVNGENVVKVAFAQGNFVQSGASTWKEYSAEDVQYASPLFTFREDRRDAWSVYLTDTSRGVKLQLDLHTKIIYYSDKTTPPREQYTVTKAYVLP